MPEFPQISRAGKWNIIIQQGSTFARTLNFGAFDVSEYEFRGSIRKQYKDRNVLGEWSCQVTANNELEISMSHEVTAALPAENLVHDVEMFYRPTANSEIEFVARILEGKVRVTPEVTK
jgi:hypothetical protein